MSGSHLSKDFFDLVKAIGESKSKQEEDRIITLEVASLKGRMGEKDIAPKKMKEFLVRIIYAEMLGHDASFGYIRAVEMTASSNMIHKRVGYLCAALCLDTNHEFRFMMVNQIQRDLQSPNYMQVCAALTAVCKIMTEDMIPAVLPILSDVCMKHDKDVVRKKTVMAIHRFHQLSPSSVSHLTELMRASLCDKDPSVMGAALNILFDLAKNNVTAYKDLVPSFVSILKQITEHRLPRDFDYHRMPAPWIQIGLLKILALLGANDQSSSEGMYEVLHDVMRRADTGINVGYAIIYECVQTVISIYPNSTLLDAAAASISRFISSDVHNLKYLGVTGLAAIVTDYPKYAADHQLIVLDCLEDPDETLRRKTLDLLFRMTNPVNAEVIVDKLTNHLRETTDVFLRKDLVLKVTELAERFAPSNEWYINVMTDVFELGGDLVPPGSATSLLTLLAEGGGEDDDADTEMRVNAVEMYLELCEKPVLPDILLQVMSWTLGEYGYLSTSHSLPEVANMLCLIAERSHLSSETLGYAIYACMKVSAQMKQATPAINALVAKFSKSQSVDLQQRSREFVELLNDNNLMKNVLPVDASCEDIDVDSELSFLNGFVNDAISKGAKKYSKPRDSDDDSDDDGKDRKELKFEAYEVPTEPTGGFSYDTKALPSNAMEASSNYETKEADVGLRLNNVKSVWGAEGYKGKLPETTKAPSTPPPTSTSIYGKTTYDAPVVESAKETPITTTSTTVAPSKKVEVEEDSEEILKKKERAEKAAALFGGVSSTSSKNRGSRATRGGASATTGSAKGRTTTNTNARSSPTNEASQTTTSVNSGGGGDLLDMLGFSSPSSTPSLPSSAPPSNDSLFGGMSINGSTSAPPSSLFGGMSINDSSSPTSTAPVSSDPFALFGGGSTSPSSAFSPVASVDINSIKLSGSAGIELLSLPRSVGNELLTKDGNVTAAYYKVWSDAGPVVVIFFLNTSNNLLQNVSINLEISPLLRSEIKFEGEGTNAGNNKIAFSKIPSRQNAALIVKLSVGGFGPNSLNIKGQTSYTGGVLNFMVPLDATDFMRPAVMDTGGFGSRWSSHSSQRALIIKPSSVMNPTQFMERMEHKLRIHPVEIKPATNEAIAVGRLAGTDQLCLVHGKIRGPGEVALTIRSMNQGYSDWVASNCQKLLQ